jgi:hypothetical protein
MASDARGLGYKRSNQTHEVEDLIEAKSIDVSLLAVCRCHLRDSAWVSNVCRLRTCSRILGADYAAGSLAKLSQTRKFGVGLRQAGIHGAEACPVSEVRYPNSDPGSEADLASD